MNRIFKFRVWHKKDKQFLKNGYTWFRDKSSGYDTDEDSSTQNIIIQQFTGLKDKNEKDIYEGDILKSINKIWGHRIIGYKGSSFKVFQSKYQYKHTHGEGENLEFILNQDESLEIIGNIFENPKLMP